MDETEIKKCAAILTAGVIAGGKGNIVTPTDVVELFEEIAEIIRDNQKGASAATEEWL